MSQWMSADDMRNKLLVDLLKQFQQTNVLLTEILEYNTKALTALNDQIYMMRRDHDEYKEEICHSLTMLGIKSPNSSEYDDGVNGGVIDNPAVGFTQDNRKVSTSEGFSQTTNDYEGAVRDEEDNDTEI